MCSPNMIHPFAEDDRFRIKSGGASVSQRSVLQAAWNDAVDACHTRSLGGLLRGQVFTKGRMFLSVQTLYSLLLTSTVGEAVVCEYTDGTGSCLDLLACDVKGSGWMLGPLDPQVRAAVRIP